MRTTKLAIILVLLAITTPVFGQKVVTGTGQPQKKLVFPDGAWWRNQRYVSLLSLTAEQQKRIDDVFQQSRLRLIDLNANLDKEEAILEPLMQAERLDEARTAAQIDKVADARAELEKANARMLLGIRQALTPEQWKMLDAYNGKLAWPGTATWKVAPETQKEKADLKAILKNK